MDNNLDKSGEQLQEIVKEFVTKMGFDSFTVDLIIKKEEEKEIIICDIKTKESNFLIGQHGVNLQSLQHLVRLLARKNISDQINFIVDVNSYRQEKNESVITLAKNMAQEALREKRAVVLRPMSPYERRLIHMELAKISAVKSESIGEGEDRRIVIKPADLI